MNDLIFISIASYRDPEVIPTIINLISTAEKPQNLRIVIYEQNGPEDASVKELMEREEGEGSEEKYSEYFKEPYIRVISDHYSKAKGPVYARARIQSLYSDEEYYLQLDSHMRAIRDWDKLLKHMLRLVPSPGVLTQYPPEYMKLINGNYVETIDKSITRSGLYIQGFGKTDKFTRIQSDIINLPVPARHFPYTNKAWAACFSFSKGTIIRDCPYDPTLEFLFFGEELDITIRLFTKGYYFYSPHISVFYTYFRRHYRRTFWGDIDKNVRETGESISRELLWNRIKSLSEEKFVDLPSDYYGTIRTLKEYEEFADIASLLNSKLKPCAKAFRRITNRPVIR
jgi:[Skp1-protein]-hydroxyproline N-acetylglucosaminyltransferase